MTAAVAPDKRNRPFNLKQAAFIAEYCKDKNATQAAIRAGYSENAAAEIGYELLRKPQIADEVEKRLEVYAKTAGLTTAWVLRKLKRNVLRSSQAVPVTDHEGNPTGTYQFYPNAVNKGAELIGKHLGMFADAPTVVLNVGIMTLPVVERPAPPSWDEEQAQLQRAEPAQIVPRAADKLKALTAGIEL